MIHHTKTPSPNTSFHAKHIWKTVAPPKVRFFFWLVMHGRCWTAHRRFRHGLQESNSCILCDQLPETMDHLLVGCVYSREVWGFILRKLHLQDVIVLQEEKAMESWLRNRKLIGKEDAFKGKEFENL